MKDIAYYNGKIGRIDEVQAPITDRGLYFGDGVYDAAMVRNRKIFALDDHLDRFYNSLRLLRIEPPMERSELAATLNDLVSRLDSDAPHMLYWQSTRAAAHRKHAFPAGAKATLMAFAEACPLDRHDHPYKLITVEDTRFLHCNIKTLNLIPNCMAMQRAVEAATRSCSTAATASPKARIPASPSSATACSARPRRTSLSSQASRASTSSTCATSWAFRPA